MEGLTQALIVVGLFLLRLGVPIAVTAAVALIFGRLDARWQREAESLPAAAQLAAAAQIPCWQEKGCTEQQRANCPACRFTDLPCWLARLRVEDRLPAACPGCSRFAPVSVST